MRNIYQKSKLLSMIKSKNLEKMFEKVWIKETALPKSQAKWSENNKAYGQCAVTSLIVQDIFGGKLIASMDGSHFWNELPDGTQQDFSRKQFKKPKDFSKYRYVTRKEILDSKGAKLAQTRKRYLKFKRLVSKLSNSFV